MELAFQNAGIEELHAAYKEHGMPQTEFLGPRYYRIKMIRARLDRGELDRELRWIE